MKKSHSNFLLPCFYCGVDSGPVLTFFLWLIGASLLGFLFIYGWGLAIGKFDIDRDPSQLPLQAEVLEAETNELK